MIILHCNDIWSLTKNALKSKEKSYFNTTLKGFKGRRWKKVFGLPLDEEIIHPGWIIFFSLWNFFRLVKLPLTSIIFRKKSFDIQSEEKKTTCQRTKTHKRKVRFTMLQYYVQYTAEHWFSFDLYCSESPKMKNGNLLNYPLYRVLNLWNYLET